MKTLRTLFILTATLIATATIATTTVEAQEITVNNETYAVPADAKNVTELGIANDGSNVSKKLNNLPSGTYYFPAGTYGVNGFDKKNDIWEGFRPKSNSTYIFADEAIIQVLANDYPFYAGIFILNEDNVTLINPTVIGDREDHEFNGNSTHEWGHGIQIMGSKTGTITILSPTVTDVTGDGIDILSGKANVTITDLTIERARRQGISIEDAGTVLIDGGTINDISGVSPASGIDIEPYEVGQHLDHITIRNITTTNTAQGLLFYNLHMAPEHNITIENSSFDGMVVMGNERTENGQVTIIDTEFTGNNMGVTWTDSYANFTMINPTFEIDNLKNSEASEGIFVFYEFDKANGDNIGGLTVIGAKVLNHQSESEDTVILNFFNSTKTTLSNISIEIEESNLTNEMWAYQPSTLNDVVVTMN